MEITVAALLFTKRNMNIDHKKSSENSELKCI